MSIQPLSSVSSGVDRRGLEDVLGNNGHPKNGLAYLRELLGGELIGVQTLTEGRYAAFFKRYSYVEAETVKKSVNRILLFSTVSGNSRTLDIEQSEEWIDFDTDGENGYLLLKSGGEVKVRLFKSDVDNVRILSEVSLADALATSGKPVVFDRGITVDGAYLLVSGSDGEGVFFTRKRRAEFDSSNWELYSDNSFTSYGMTNSKLVPLMMRGGILEVKERALKLSVRGSEYVINIGGGLEIFKRDRYGFWVRHSTVAPPVVGESSFFTISVATPFSLDKSAFTLVGVTNHDLDKDIPQQEWSRIPLD